VGVGEVIDVAVHRLGLEPAPTLGRVAVVAVIGVHRVLWSACKGSPTDMTRQTVGVWRGPEDEELFERFDDEVVGDHGSRSEAIKRSMHDRLIIEAAAEELGVALPDNPRERRALLRQAVIDALRG